MQQADFLEIVMPFKDRLFRLAKRLLVSTEEAEDATQEVIVKLWTLKEEVKDFNNIEAFAMRVTKNYCLDQLKSKRASNLKLVHNNYEESGYSLQKHIELKDNLQWIDKILETLPKQQRMIVQLRDIEQYEFFEIEAIMQINQTAIRVSLSRARKVIREALRKTHGYGISK